MTVLNNTNSQSAPPFSPGNAAASTFQQFSSAPTPAYPGRVYYDTTLGYPLVYGEDNIWHGILLS